MSSSRSRRSVGIVTASTLDFSGTSAFVWGVKCAKLVKIKYVNKVSVQHCAEKHLFTMIVMIILFTESQQPECCQALELETDRMGELRKLWEIKRTSQNMKIVG